MVETLRESEHGRLLIGIGIMETEACRIKGQVGHISNEAQPV